MSDPNTPEPVDGDSDTTVDADGDSDTTVDADSPTDLRALSSRVEELATRVDEDIEDLRERLVRVYRDVEGKAETDHTHPETIDRIESLAADLDRVDDDLDAIDDDLDAVDETIEATARLERDLDALADRTETLAADIDDATESAADAENRVDDLAAQVESLAEANEDAVDKLSRVASAVVRTQRRMRAVEHERAERERLDDILAEANRHGVRTAECDGCGNGVRLSLLSKPECPYCESRIDAIDPGRRFIGTSWLRVDDTPALEGAVASTADDGETAGETPEGESTDATTNRESTAQNADTQSDPAGSDVSTRDTGSEDGTDSGVERRR